jgi:hypothetical protein
MCERALHLVESAQGMSFESAITIILTALAVMLAVVTLGIGALAIWGYLGIRDSVRDMAGKRVDEALKETLRKYPDAAEIIRTMELVKAQADLLDQLRNQAVTAPEPKSVAIASKPVVQGEVGETPLESIEQQATPIAKYPGEEDGHGNSSS